MEIGKMKKMFRVDNPGKFANIDGKIPMWSSGEPSWKDHLNGTNSLCVTPIGRDNTCYWGALDIDSKGDSPSVNHEAIQMFIEEHSLPLNLFYSKSGKGAHVYIFSTVPTPAINMVATLKLYATLIAPLLHETNGIEIFPKQTELGPDDNGSCIRPPYFGNKCQPLFEKDPIIKPAITLPPCLQTEPEEGDRNNFIYHMSNFLVISGATSVKRLMETINNSLVDPLPDVEVDRTVASAMRQRSRKGAKFGLGCTHCPDIKKDKCKFFSQVRVNSISESVSIEIVHYIAENPNVRMTVEGKSIIFSMDDLFDNHKVRLDFILKHRITSVPLTGKKDWYTLLHDMLETAEHVDVITHRDKGHFILQQLKKWSKDFKSGISHLYSGTPVFISKDEVALFPHDVFNRFNTMGVQGVTREDINIALESMGSPLIFNGEPLIKVPAGIFGTRSEGIEVQVVNDIDENEVSVCNDEDGNVIFKNHIGAVIELTNTYIKEHPAIQRKILEMTNTNININY